MIGRARPDRPAPVPRLTPSHVCLVTGASGGIGKEIARTLAHTGGALFSASHAARSAIPRRSRGCGLCARR